MSAQVDTTTKLSYLLPTGTFLTFQVLAPLATNNGHCGRTEQILTALTLALLVSGCITTSFTDSYTAPDGKVYNGFLTYKGLWVPGYGATELPDQDEAAAAPRRVSSEDIKIQSRNKRDDYIQGPTFKPLATDYINAALSAIGFLTLTMFTDPVSSCFYPHLSDTVLKTLPVLLATVLSFCCSFATRIRHGYGNSVPRSLIPAPIVVLPVAAPSLGSTRDHSSREDHANADLDVATKHRVDNVV